MLGFRDGHKHCLLTVDPRMDILGVKGWTSIHCLLTLCVWVKREPGLDSHIIMLHDLVKDLNIYIVQYLKEPSSLLYYEPIDLLFIFSHLHLYNIYNFSLFYVE